MKFLLTNDDGIDAPGLAALEQIARQLGQCTVVAPKHPLSGCSHQTTTHAAVQISEAGAARFAVAGTPVDCVRIGLQNLVPDADWVLSGINDGANLGVDVYMSGTVAAAREARWLGKPAIAISQYRARGSSRQWDKTTEQARRVISELLANPTDDGCYINVNLPDGQPSNAPRNDSEQQNDEIVFCPLDPHPLPVQFRLDGDSYTYCGVYQQRKRDPGSDVDVCFAGQVAATVIRSFP